MQTYLVLDRDGNLMAPPSTDPSEAAAHAQGLGEPWIPLTSGQQITGPRAQNPVNKPAFSMSQGGLHEIHYDALKIDLDDAYAAIRPVFEEARRGYSAEIQALRASGARTKGGGLYDPKEKGLLELNDMLSVGKGLLKANTKLQKVDPRIKEKAMTLGLVLLPEHVAFSGESASTPPVQIPYMEPAHGNPRLGRASSLCAYSTNECRAACLVYSGQNQNSINNNYAKMATAKAFLSYPEAFMRVFAESLRVYGNQSIYLGQDISQARKFVRLNVFSDIPWELVAPWLFHPEFVAELGDLVSYYDYTKVGDRVTPDNYHLSFSYSGSPENKRQCQIEFSHGRNIVMVFWTPDYKHAGVLKSPWTRKRKRLETEIEEAVLTGHATPTYVKTRRRGISEAKKGFKEAYLKGNPLPAWVECPDFLGGQRVPVIDGDRSDLRPYDQILYGPGKIVGLRWKPPKTSAGAQVGKSIPKNFVISGEQVEGPNGPVFQVSAENPHNTPLGDE